MAIKLSKKHFWQWFMRSNKEYLGLQNKSKKELKYCMNEMTTHLRAYFKFLHFSILVSNDGATGVLTISVSGKAQYFKYVDKIVGAAPEIPGWNIHALEAPKPIDSFWEQELGHTGIDPHELWCTVPDREHRPRIAVYHMMYTEANNWHYTQAAEMAIYNVLGERSFGLDIGRITVANFSSAPEDAELIKLEELPAYMPHSQSGLVVDALGQMWER
jgi:hypothetical protein